MTGTHALDPDGGTAAGIKMGAHRWQGEDGSRVNKVAATGVRRLS